MNRILISKFYLTTAFICLSSCGRGYIANRSQRARRFEKNRLTNDNMLVVQKSSRNTSLDVAYKKFLHHNFSLDLQFKRLCDLVENNPSLKEYVVTHLEELLEVACFITSDQELKTDIVEKAKQLLTEDRNSLLISNKLEMLQNQVLQLKVQNSNLQNELSSKKYEMIERVVKETVTHQNNHQQKTSQTSQGPIVLAGLQVDRGSTLNLNFSFGEVHVNINDTHHTNVQQSRQMTSTTDHSQQSTVNDNSTKAHFNTNLKL